MHIFFSFTLFSLFYLSPIVHFAFSDIEFETVFSKAKTEQKNVFIKYEANWSEQCAFLNDSILANPFIQSIISEEYIEVVARLGDPQSNRWFQQYQISCVPTVQILDMDGNILLEDYIPSEEDLYAQLLNHVISRDLTADAKGEKTVEIGAYESIGDQIPTTASYHSISRMTDKNTRLPDSQSSIPFTSEYSESLISTTPKVDEYTVTVGAFSVLKNAEQHRQSIILKYVNTEVFIEQDPAKNLFRVNAGKFASPQSCQPLKMMLKENNINCYIRRLPSEARIN